MGVKISKRCSPFKSLSNYSKLLLNVLLNGLHKESVLDYLNLNLKFKRLFL